MFRQSRSPAALLIASALLAVACSDHRTPTAPLAPSSDPSALQGSAGRVKFKSVQLSSNTLRIDGPAVTAAVSLGNSGQAVQSGVSIRAEVAQPAAYREAANLPTQCRPGDPAGFVPTGSCDMTIVVTTSNSAPGAGTLVPGVAVLRVHLLQIVGGVETEVDSRNIDVNLVAPPSISALTLTSTTLTIDGPSVGWTATLQNPAKSLQNVALQGTIVQGTTRRAAGGVLVTCGSSAGVMPPGTCTVSFAAAASNSGSGSGTLVPGAATFELKMTQTVNGVATTLDTRTVAVTLIALVSSPPKITSLVLASTSIQIGGSVAYTVQIQNTGVAMSDVFLQGEMTQQTGTVTVTKGANGTYMTCVATVGVLPTGTCTIQWTAAASSDATGGALQPGSANFVLHLYQANGINVAPTELDVVTVPVTLVGVNPTITSFTPASTNIVLGSGSTSYTATIENPGAARSTFILQNWISQGSARRAAGGSQVLCSGAPTGQLPAGTCTTTSEIVADNTQAGGTGTLVLGPATLEVELQYYDGTTQVILETKTYPITLVSP